MTDQLNSTDDQLTEAADPAPQMVGKARAAAQPQVEEIADAVTEPTVGVAESVPPPVKLIA
jgi:hypothetical protein